MTSPASATNINIDNNNDDDDDDADDDEDEAEDDYDGDYNNSDDTSDDVNSSDDEDSTRNAEGHQPVVTFLEDPHDLSQSGGDAAYYSVAEEGADGTHDSASVFAHRLHRQRLNAAREPRETMSPRRNTSRTSLLQRRTKSKGSSSLRARLGIKNHVRSHSTLSQLFSSSSNANETEGLIGAQTPANTPAAENVAPSLPSPTGVRDQSSTFLNIQDHSPSDNRWTPRQRSRSQASPLPLNTFAAHWAATIDSYDLGRRQRNSRISNSDDSVRTDPLDSSDGPPKPLGLPRAYTLDELDTN
ncbi:hypothetical protein FBU59_007189, partial [Linderina macrospora]